MNKKTGRLIAFGLSCCMMFSNVGCDKKEISKNENIVTESSYGQVWSAPNTVKIQQNDIDYAEKGAAFLSYQAVRNEYENAQLFITAREDVEHFELQPSDLKSGEDVLESENFTVYLQKYVSFIDSYYGSNIMPDALIPMDTADAYEENKILSDTNGALWITAYIPKDTNPGVYEGYFKLVIDGEKGQEKMDIPVSVQVYDYTLPDKTEAKTVFTWTYDCLAVGELNGSIEMMQTYYEFFLDYGISLQQLPIETMSGEEYVNTLLKYWDKNTTNTLMLDAGTLGSYNANNVEKFVDQILSMAAATTEEQNLFEKTFIYHTDEPDIRDENKREKVISDSKQIKATLQSCVDVIKADTSDTYAGLKKIENWEDYIVNIRQIQTFVEYATEWVIANQDSAECEALLESMNTIYIKPIPEEDILKLKEIAAAYGIEVWWYTCNVPAAPAANYHIGCDNLLSPRTISWYQAKYGIEGTLYWRAAASVNDSAENEYNDVYTNPFYFQGCPAGDGFLVYPGAAYGIYGPLPSLRLMSIRDGMEEYNLLKSAEEKFRALEAELGEGFSAMEAMDTFYNSLGEGIENIYKDGEHGLDFTTLRTELLKTLTSFETGLSFLVGDVEIADNIATVTYFASEDATVSIQGEEQTPIEGRRYQYTIDLTKETILEAVVTNGEGESLSYSRFIDYPSYVLNTMDTEDVLEGVAVSDGCSAELAKTEQYATDGTSLHLKVNGILTGNVLADASFTPSVSIAAAVLGDTDITKLSAITLDIYNPGELFKTEIRLYSGATYVSFGEFEIVSGKMTLELKLDADSLANIGTVERMAFEFENTDAEENVRSYEFYLDNINGK